MDNAARCPALAHRSAAAHKLHSARFGQDKIRESQNHLSGSGFSLFLPGGCPSDRDHRSVKLCRRICAILLLYPIWLFGSIVANNVGRILSGFSFTPIALAQGLVLTVCCLVCLLVLLWPEFRRHADKTT